MQKDFTVNIQPAENGFTAEIVELSQMVTAASSDEALELAQQVIFAAQQKEAEAILARRRSRNQPKQSKTA